MEQLVLNLSEMEKKMLIRVLQADLSNYEWLYINSHRVDKTFEIEDDFADEDITEVILLMSLINKIEGVDVTVTPDMAIDEMKKCNERGNIEREYDLHPLIIVRDWKEKERRFDLNFWKFKSLYEEAKKSDIEEFINRPRSEWMGNAHPQKIVEILHNIHRMANGGIKEIVEIYGGTMKDLSESFCIPYATINKWKANDIPERNKILMAFAVLQ